MTFLFVFFCFFALLPSWRIADEEEEKENTAVKYDDQNKTKQKIDETKQSNGEYERDEGEQMRRSGERGNRERRRAVEKRSSQQ
ncbi:uncharacterized protein BO72DRAFT_448261 [Aspergillus fijiensis CBS 313.89]|uniref:Secreted protein n=1 Tax=Aspergillus fijiensis CBS 313.89 TaxID=1448319 RepID=A0A8G1VYF4_9EURO|nr:uncharacterized protein BO72DRAFT_448261 [Aspergillus fijiensis CBS 313.89]RAK77192.1 hypothetical protein BO72DRAFT_448261 [Aspergillus fijiensis CBS 313.89]